MGELSANALTVRATLPLGSTTSNEERLKEQLVPFGDDFPLVTAAEARAFEFSGWGYKD
jgi:hypothetical protein